MEIKIKRKSIIITQSITGEVSRYIYVRDIPKMDEYYGCVREDDHAQFEIIHKSKIVSIIDPDTNVEVSTEEPYEFVVDRTYFIEEESSGGSDGESDEQSDDGKGEGDGKDESEGEDDKLGKGSDNSPSDEAGDANEGDSEGEAEEDDSQGSPQDGEGGDQNDQSGESQDGEASEGDQPENDQQLGFEENKGGQNGGQNNQPGKATNIVKTYEHPDGIVSEIIKGTKKRRF